MGLDIQGANDLQNLVAPERLSGDLFSEGGLSREAYSLLAQANLLRMRGSWQEATEKCMGALRLSPENSSAQSLLGDIYENQGRLDDAIQWYRMALDVQPDGPADQAKLAQLLERKALAARANAAASQSHSSESEASRHASPASKTGFDRWRSDPDQLVRRGTYIAGSLAILVVVIAVLWVRSSGPLAEIGSGRQVHAPNVLVSSTQTVPPKAPTTLVEPPLPVGDPADVSLLTSLKSNNSLTQQGIVPESIQTDPRSGRLTLTVGCQAQQEAVLSRDAIISDSVTALQAVVGQPVPDTITQFTIRCLLVSPNGGSTPLAFTADASSAEVVALNPDLSMLTTSQIAAILTNQWWSPNIAHAQ